MKLDPILTKASRLARSGKYEAAIRLLQPEVNRYHGSFRYYYLLGASCLHSGDTGGALTYFRLAHETNSKNPLAILGLAVLYLRRGETDRAVDLYLDVLELSPKNRIAKRAMKLIRKYAGTEAFSALLLETGKISSLFPRVPFAGFYRKEILAAIGVFAAACIIAYGVFGLYASAAVNNFAFVHHSFCQCGFARTGVSQEHHIADVVGSIGFHAVIKIKRTKLEKFHDFPIFPSNTVLFVVVW